jgi:hypothetical protein
VVMISRVCQSWQSRAGLRCAAADVSQVTRALSCLSAIDLEWAADTEGTTPSTRAVQVQVLVLGRRSMRPEKLQQDTAAAQKRRPADERDATWDRRTSWPMHTPKCDARCLVGNRSAVPARPTKQSKIPPATSGGRAACFLLLIVSPFCPFPHPILP